jgi:peptidoglycan-associated lipoprotein
MKKHALLTLSLLCFCLLTLGSCNKDLSDDSTSMGNYKRAKERILWGSQDSEEFASLSSSLLFTEEDDFVPLQDEDLKQQFTEAVFKQPKESPGEEESSIPGINGFETPQRELASIFQLLHFNTDEHCLRNAEDQKTIQKIADYLKGHKNTYIFVEGHCDQRAPEAYNLSLGTRRANSIRSLLIQQGVSPEQIYTISYGKERLLNTDSSPSAWAQNRRAGFKVFSKK